MDSTEDYRRRAVAAEVMAANTPDDLLRAGFLNLAQQWRALAEQVEAHDSPPAGSEPTYIVGDLSKS